MLNSIKAILLGCPGSGKGTLGQRISTFFSIPVLSTGKLLRARFPHEEKDHSSGIDNGMLIEDEKIISILKETLIKKEYSHGVILDGYPRTIRQAKLLDDETKENGTHVVILDVIVDAKIAIKRIVGRFMCSECDSIYNLFFKLPKSNSIILTHDMTVKDLLNGSSLCKCDNCGSETFYNRKDDTEEIALKRYEEYVKNTLPLSEYYKDRRLYFNFDGNNSPQSLYDKVQKILQIRKNTPIH